MLTPDVHDLIDRKRRIAGYTNLGHYLAELAIREVTGSDERAAVLAARSAAFAEARQAVFQQVREFFTRQAQKFQSV